MNSVFQKKEKNNYVANMTMIMETDLNPQKSDSGAFSNQAKMKSPILRNGWAFIFLRISHGWRRAMLKKDLNMVEVEKLLAMLL